MQTISTKGHVAGWPISYGSYVRGCRCDACRAMQNQYRRQRRAKGHVEYSKKAQNKAQNRAAQYVRQQHPAVWAELLAAAYAEVRP
jgi:hypothetical protein